MTEPDGPSVAVVVSTRDRPELLRGLVGAVSRLTRPPDHLVVVDSASVDPAVRRVAAEAGAEVVRSDLPGLGRARNAGLAVVREEVVAFTDDDCLPEPDWLTALLEAFAHPSRPDFVTGAVRADREPPRRAGLSVALAVDSDARVLGPTDDPRQFGHGANMAWRRQAITHLGGFDATMGVGSALRAGEDVDAWWRGVRAGMTGYFAPDAVVVHRQWRTRRSALRSYYGYGVGAGAVAVKRYRQAAATGKARARRDLARQLLLTEGLAPVWRSVRRGYQMAAVADALMFVGGLRGARLAGGLPIVDGHFGAGSR